MTLAKMIRQLRNEVGLTRAELAEQVGISEQSLRLWERGGVMPTLQNLKRLAPALRVNFVKLVKAEPPEHVTGKSGSDHVRRCT